MTSTDGRCGRGRWLFGSMRRALVLLIVLAIVPLLLTQVVISALWFRSRRALDEENNYLTALAVARAFEDFVRDVNRQELAVGIAEEWLKPRSSDRMTRYLQANSRDLPSVRILDVVDCQGKIISSTEPRNIGRPFDTSSAWYRAILAGQQRYVTDLLPGRPVNQPAFAIARRIEDESGALLGVSVAEVDANRLGVLFRHIDVTEGAMYGLVDRTGTLVYIAPEIEMADRNFRVIDPVLESALSTGEAATGTFMSGVDHRQRLGTRIPVYDTGWVAGSSKPTSVLLAPLIRTLCLIGLLNLVVIVLSALAAGLLGRQVLRSVQSLRSHSLAVAQGDLAHRTEVTGIRELEDLADSFNRMGGCLQAAREAQQQAHAVLEQRVAERTAALYDANELLKREIAEREWSQAALTEQSRILEAFYEHTMGPLVFLDKDLRILRVNAAYARAARGKVEDFLGRNYFEIYSRNKADEERFHEVLRTKKECQEFAREYRFPDRPESEPTYWDWALVPVLDEHGEVDFLIYTLQEVTERKLAEDRLRESERKLRAIFDHTFQFIGLMACDGTVLEANRGALEALAVDKASVLGQFFWDTPWWRHSANLRDKIRTAVRSAAEGQFVRLEATHQTPDGRLIDVDFSLTPVRDESGRVVLLVPEGRDITERKRAEEELAKYRDHLEELVLERTTDLELANQYLETEIAQRKHAAQALEKTAEELTRSNRELEQFAYIASHDLQEPLRVISGYLQLLNRRYQGRFDADADQFIEYAVEGAQRMQQLIADLLDYSRVGRRGKEFLPTDLEGVLGETLRGLQRGIEEAGAVITHDPLPTVQGDHTQLVQLFQNLIGNGIKFRGEGRPEIHVSAQRDGDRWVLSVRDNGIGIDRQYWDQVFVIFQRLHSRQKYSGTGIGLAICKRIVERHGGRIWMDSEVGKGSTFYFTI